VRGVAPILESFKPLRDLGYQPTPNQIFGWGYGGLPFQYNYAAPSVDVRAHLKTITPRLRELVTGPSHLGFAGPVELSTNGQQIIWTGLPGAVPELGVMRNAGQEFLTLSCFPPSRGTNPPPQLYQAFTGRDELVAFDFELTEYRLPHWRQFYQLAEIASHRQLSTMSNRFQVWLDNAGPKLGEAVTELRSTSPKQMTFVRKSSLGLTAVELVTLGRWLDSTNFPAYGVFLPPPEKHFPSRGNRPPTK